MLEMTTLAKARQGLEALAQHLVATLQNVVSVPASPAGPGGSPVAKAVGTTGEGIFRWHPDRSITQKVKRSARGAPVGSPPFMRTGQGMRSIAYRMSPPGSKELYVEIGVRQPRNEAYMAFHEWGIRYPTSGPNRGTGGVQRRPWLAPLLARYAKQFKSIITVHSL